MMHDTFNGFTIVTNDISIYTISNISEQILMDNGWLKNLHEILRKLSEFISTFRDIILGNILNQLNFFNKINSLSLVFDESFYIDSQPNAPPLLDKIELYLIFLWQFYLDTIFPWCASIVIDHYGKILLLYLLGIS